MEFRLRLPGSSSNLGPGYDVLGLALTICNRLTVRTLPGSSVRIAVRGMGKGVLPEDETNLFYRSAVAASERAGKPLPGLEVEMTNTIPLARGLGSSSTAIVAGIVAANTLLDNPFSRDQMLDLAADLEGHPDNVAPCLLGGLVVSAFSDRHVTYIRAIPPPGLQAVVAVPDFELETKAARAALPANVPHADAVFNVGRACLITAALLTGNFEALRTAMVDRLHQPYRAALIPGFYRVLGAAENAGALGAALSGAGPAIMALVTDAADAVKEAMVDAWKAEGIRAEASVYQIDPDGVTVE